MVPDPDMAPVPLLPDPLAPAPPAPFPVPLEDPGPIVLGLPVESSGSGALQALALRRKAARLDTTQVRRSRFVMVPPVDHQDIRPAGDAKPG